MKFSIITATYNSEATIEDALKSVASQSYSNIEHIIIDGGSKDNTLKIIENYKDKIAYFVSEPDKGIYDALNKGINAATGDVIGFLHADDLFYSNLVLEKTAKQFSENITDSIYGDLLYVSKENTEKVIRNWKAGKYSIKKLKRGWMPPHPTFYVKKDVYVNFGTFDTDFKIAADYDFILRVLGKYKISTNYLPEIMIKMRVGGESNKNINNIIRKMKEDVNALKKNNLGNWQTVFLKNIIKIPQLFLK
jgi:glycosyltransferase